MYYIVTLIWEQVYNCRADEPIMILDEDDTVQNVASRRLRGGSRQT